MSVATTMDERLDLSGKEAILLAGPTASGKSNAALHLARRFDGTIVNADSMQVYEGLRLLTARPDEADLRRAPHRLYGHVDPAHRYSVGEYLRDARAALRAIRAEGRLPIFCGGTGLYFRALLGALDDMPQVPGAVRDGWQKRLGEEGAAALHDLLRERDPDAARRIAPSDGQRIVRALAVGEVSGQPMSSFQAGKGTGLLDPAACAKIVLTPPREILRARIGERFRVMVENGALDEVAALRARPGIEHGSAIKAIGVAELSGVLDGDDGLERGIERSVTRSRQYAKRQETWFRHQFDAGWWRLEDAGELLER